MEEDRVACRQVGMHNLLSKPLDTAQLDAALGKVAAVVKPGSRRWSPAGSCSLLSSLAAVLTFPRRLRR